MLSIMIFPWVWLLFHSGWFGKRAFILRLLESITHQWYFHQQTDTIFFFVTRMDTQSAAKNRSILRKESRQFMMWPVKNLCRFLKKNKLCAVFSRMNVYIYLVRDQSPLAAKFPYISPRFANATVGVAVSRSRF